MFLIALLVNGALAGTVYALIALAFVVVYKASRMMNFALGEMVGFAARLVAVGFHGLGLGLAGSLGFAWAGMVGFAAVWNRLVLRHLIGQRLIALIMVTIGLGTVLRALMVFAFRGMRDIIPLPIPQEPLNVYGILCSTDKLLAAAIATGCIVLISGFFQYSRTGVALRAIADDQQAAMLVGIDVQWHFVVAWSLVGTLAVVAGTLWTFIAGGSFGMVLVGMKVFPIVILGGLDSIPGTIVSAVAIGMIESVAAGYLDPLLGGGFSTVLSYIILLVVLFVRPYGLLGKADIARV